MNREDIVPIIRGLILMNVFGFRLHEADFWNKIHEKVSGEQINIDPFKIMRLGTADELHHEERQVVHDYFEGVFDGFPDTMASLTVVNWNARYERALKEALPEPDLNMMPMYNDVYGSCSQLCASQSK